MAVTRIAKRAGKVLSFISCLMDFPSSYRNAREPEGRFGAVASALGKICAIRRFAKSPDAEVLPQDRLTSNAQLEVSEKTFTYLVT
jgi:hypothetical protein